MKNSSFILFTFLFLIIKISKCQYSSFGMDLDAYQERCLNEYYKVQTVIILEVNCEIKDILTQIRSPNGRIIYYNTNTTSIFSFTTQNDGYYNFCMKNLGDTNTEINLVIKSGIGANDYSSVAKSKDLEPIDFELDKILEKESLFNHFNRISQEKQEMFGFLYKSISNKIIFYSILLIIGMVLIGIVETLYLKRFMERRKII